MPELHPAEHVEEATQGDYVHLLVDLGHFSFRRVRVMIFPIPEEGFKDPQTGVIFKRDNYRQTIEAANDRDHNKIYQRGRRELRVEQRAAGNRGKNYNIERWNRLDQDADPVWEKDVMVPLSAKPGPYLIKVKIININGIVVTRSWINVE
jgi:hypothetical protein